ncbi:M protein repeat protein [Seminavis robusta]|uniref:M protein repeat protein n=1 Tax=Seminavis robusta TaxID=568900 RepID=A0A9N8H5R3_9STRA|nr:M protein repeat protein [Seminavis robusta]|eukprot:Sro29_g019110.1 M protein repeat protein (446) ;mRNA; f:66661-68183
MKFSTLLASGFFAAAVSAFQPAFNTGVAHTRGLAGPLSVATFTGTVDIQETAQRDVYTMQDWARNCGVQTAEGFELTTNDGYDWSAMTNQYIPAGTPILYVPQGLVISSSDVEGEFGGNLLAAENMLSQNDETAKRLPLFRLMVKILSEYEQGQQSPYFPWLNSLPRLFYNGVAMTDACFDCLPPYAAALSMQERNTFSRFLNVLKKGYLPLSQETLENDDLMRWAYNVGLTRFTEVWQPVRAKNIAPLADMFNHATDANVALTYDEYGNCMATALQDIAPGSPLTISLGDPSNPTPLFAKYGFLYNDSPTIFCKAVQLENQIKALGYDFKDLLFFTQTGEISPKVWDIFLYSLLEQDPNGEGFFAACKSNDEATKQAYHGQYFPYTLDAVKAHVGNILQDIDVLTNKANSYDVRTHPRVPVIVAHNELVKSTFMLVQQQLNAMG